MQAQLYKETVHARMLAETKDTFIYQGYIYERQNRETLSTIAPQGSKGVVFNKLSSVSEYTKSSIKIRGTKELISSKKFYLALEEFQKNYNFNDLVNTIFKEDPDCTDWTIHLLLTSNYM